MTAAVTPIDNKKLWLAEEIWPEIHAMMHNDGYFRLWLKAQEAAAAPYGPISQMVSMAMPPISSRLPGGCVTTGRT